MSRKRRENGNASGNSIIIFLNILFGAHFSSQEFRIEFYSYTSERTEPCCDVRRLTFFPNLLWEIVGARREWIESHSRLRRMVSKALVGRFWSGMMSTTTTTPPEMRRTTWFAHKKNFSMDTERISRFIRFVMVDDVYITSIFVLLLFCGKWRNRIEIIFRSWIWIDRDVWIYTRHSSICFRCLLLYMLVQR